MRQFASFLLSLTGDDEVVFALHHVCDSQQSMQQLDDAFCAISAVYATKPDPLEQELAAIRISRQDHEVFLATDFALVIGQPPAESLKVCLRGAQVLLM